MSVKVKVPLPSGTSTTVSTPNSINTNVVSKRGVTAVQSLADVDATNVQDGYTLIYNQETKKWEAVNPATSVKPTAIDGGTY